MCFTGLIAPNSVGHSGGFDHAPPIAEDYEPIDKKIDLAAAIHILDADSSQALAVEEAKAGRNLSSKGHRALVSHKRSPTSSQQRYMANALFFSSLKRRQRWMWCTDG